MGSIQYPRGPLGSMTSSAGLGRLLQASHKRRTAAARARSRTVVGASTKIPNWSPTSVVSLAAEPDVQPNALTAISIAPVGPAT
eukprot:1601390-Pyramimonas_sp.AAC.1